MNFKKILSHLLIITGYLFIILKIFLYYIISSFIINKLKYFVKYFNGSMSVLYFVKFYAKPLSKKMPIAT